LRHCFFFIIIILEFFCWLAQKKTNKTKQKSQVEFFGWVVVDSLMADGELGEFK
jgi:hypothetical protein